MLPSIFGENLFDEFFNDFRDFDREFERMNRETNRALYGRKARNLMKTDVRETIPARCSAASTSATSKARTSMRSSRTAS